MAGLTISGQTVMTVPVGGEHMAALRAFLTDDDAFDRISALQTRTGAASVTRRELKPPLAAR